MAYVKLILNGTTVTPLRCRLTKEGDRAIDQIRVDIPYNESVSTNQDLIWLQDYTSLTSLKGVWNFQTSVKDESGNNNHGTATSVTYGNDQWGGRTGIFNGTASKVEIPDSDSLDFSGKFDIITWVKWTETTSNMTILSKRSSGSNGWALQVNASSAGDVKFSIGSSTVTSSSAGYNDGNWHFIRVFRNASNLITLQIDNTSKGTVSSTTNLTDTNVLRIGRDHTSDFFNGSISRVRLYNDNIVDSEAKKLYEKANPRSVMKFGGKVTKIADKTVKKEIIAQSFGKVLPDTEVRGTVYDLKSPEFILEDLITNNTDFEWVSRGNTSNLIVTKFTADGKLLDIVRNFAVLVNKVFYTTPNKQFVFEPAEYNQTYETKTHGTNAKILENGYDDTEIVNDLTVLGENLRFHTVETLSGQNNVSEITLNNGAVSIKITDDGTELTPEADFNLDSVGKTVSFTSPVSGTIVADYEYEKPLFIRGTRQSSIDTYGVHAKRMIMPWISNRSDGVRFVQGYLQKYKDIVRKIKIDLGEHDNFLNENDLIYVTNSLLSISNSPYVIKSIDWTYPEYNTVIHIGEYAFDYLEYDKQIVEKLHNVESAITTIKEIRDYESPELFVTATLTGTNVQTEQHQQTLNMANQSNIYDKNRGTYGSSNYGGQRVNGDTYGSA